MGFLFILKRCYLCYNIAVKLFILALFINAVSFADSVGQYQHVLNSYSSNPNTTSGANCQGGTNLQVRENQNIQDYDPARKQDNQCVSGETYAECMKRLYKIR